jgi:Na+-driven multidrug efflux pump
MFKNRTKDKLLHQQTPALMNYQIALKVLKICVPSIVCLFLQESLNFINIIFIGKLSDEYSMAALSMINILNTSFILSMSFGFSGVLETLIS